MRHAHVRYGGAQIVEGPESAVEQHIPALQGNGQRAIVVRRGSRIDRAGFGVVGHFTGGRIVTHFANWSNATARRKLSVACASGWCVS